jgi:23S rRNA pseudouridine1911/1915/1917 synthase
LKIRITAPDYEGLGNAQAEQEVRIDKILLRAIHRTLSPSFSRARLKTIFQAGNVRLKDRPVDASFLLRFESECDVELLDFGSSDLKEPEASPAPRAFLKTLYEDEALLILEKTSGVPSVPQSRNEQGSAVNSALASHPGLAAIGPKPLEAGLLHRLDTGTSGALIFAKSNEEFDRLKNLFKARRIFKLYRAITTQAPPFSLPHRIDWPLGHDPHSRRKMLVLRGDSKKIRGHQLEAITLIHRLRSRRQGADLEIEIQTGVMHQIRAHLSALEIPIRGDALYGGEISTRLWLHAWKLIIPREGRAPLEIEAPLPEGWET